MKNEKPEPAVVTSGSIINFLNKFGVFRKFIELAQDLYDLYVPIIMSRAKRKNYRRVTLIYCCGYYFTKKYVIHSIEKKYVIYSIVHSKYIILF